MQIEWTRSLSGQIEPLAVGHYFNHVGMEADDAGDTARTALGANYARLSKLKGTSNNGVFASCSIRLRIKPVVCLIDSARVGL